MSDQKVTPPFLRTPFNYDRRAAGKETALVCKDPTLAQQQFKDECNINILFARYMDSGEMPQVLDEGLAYGDFTGIFDYQTAMNAVRTAQGTFQLLPARIKNRFDNDPQKLLEFLNDPENREEAQFLKLVKDDEPTPELAVPAPSARQPGKPEPAAKEPPTQGDKGGGKPA